MVVNHCENCISFEFKPGKRRGICKTRQKGCNSAIYGSRKACGRFVHKRYLDKED